MSAVLSLTCKAPWSSLTINADGRVAFDSIMSGSIGSIKETDLNSIWRSEEALSIRNQWKQSKWPQNCVACFKKEQTSGHSRRLFFEDILNKQTVREVNSRPQVLEFITSNLCNLQCRMCNSYASSKWISHDNKLSQLNHGYHRPTNQKLQGLSKEDIDRIFSSRELLEEVTHVSIRGGEPFFERKNLYILRKIIEQGWSHQVTLDFSTNAFTPDPAFLEILPNFRKTRIHISLEGVGELYSYIRGGNEFTFQQFEDQVKIFQTMESIEIFFAVTVQAYNITRLADIFRWFLKIRARTNEIFFKNVVVRPEYLNFGLLPAELHRLALERILELDPPLGRYYTEGHDQADMGFGGLIKRLKNGSGFTSEKSELLQRQFCQYTLDVDHLRQQSILDVLPEFDILFKNYN